MLSVVMSSVIKLSVVMSFVIILNDIVSSVIMLSVMLLSFVIVSVNMLSVIILSVVTAPNATFNKLFFGGKHSRNLMSWSCSEILEKSH